MVTLGMALQCSVFVVSLIALFVVLQPRLQLLSQYPAQWIGFTEELPARDIIASVAGTSVGQSRVCGQNEVFLSSFPIQQGLYMKLTKTKGEVLRGAEHL
jgi:hypothetical protein